MSEFISWKAQPIFISSTFTDMMAERDALRDFVFPELAERLRARHIHLEPIDLRWGVETTDKKEQEEKELLVLKVCLDEIDRCKPFLIGLIGDRYGWVPPAGRMKAAENEKGFASTIENKSITALEIEYGVLSNMDQKLRSRFYFREPLDYDKMPPEKAKEFSDMHNPELDKVFAENRLRDYKAKIVAKVGKERVYTYTDIEDFKKKVLEQIWTELDAQTKELEDTRPKTWQQEERLFLEEFIEERTIAFSGREDVINYLKEFAHSPVGYDNIGICLTGESGSGKSALFAKLHKELQQENVFIIAHAAGISLRSNSLENMLMIWIEELAEKLKIDISEQLQDKNKFDDLTKLFAELLSRTSVDHRVIVMVDALNQFERTAHAKYVNWLPELLPKNVKFIFTAIPGEETANLIKRNGIKGEELKPVTKVDAEKIITAISKRYRKSLNPEAIEILLNKKTDKDVSAYNNPLWLNMAVDEFLLLDEDDFAEMKAYGGTAEEKLNRLLLNTAHDMPADIESMYTYLFDKTRQRFGKEFVNTFFNYIALARNGLRESDIEILINDYSNQKWDVLNFAALRRYLRAHIVRKGEEGLWDFKHVQVRTEIYKSQLASIEQKVIANQHIAAYLEALPNDDSLRMTEIMWHLFKADDKVKAVKIYGSFELDTLQTKEHSKTLVDIILEDVGNVKWISDILEMEDMDESVKGTTNINFLFELSDQLKDSVRIEEQKSIYLSVFRSTLYLSLKRPDSAECSRNLSFSYHKVGDINQSLGDTKSAFLSYESSIKILEELLKKNPESDKISRDLSLSFNRIGNIYKDHGDTKNAIKSFKSALDIVEKLLKRNPSSVLFASDLAYSYNLISDIYESHGDTKSALVGYQSALIIMEELLKRNPESAQFAEDLAYSYTMVSKINFAHGDTKIALTFLESSLKVRKELLKRNPESAKYASDLAYSFINLGYIYQAHGDIKSALFNFESSMNIRIELLKRMPGLVEFAKNLSVSYMKVGDIYNSMGDTVNALSLQESSLKIRKELHENNPESVEFARELTLSYERLGNIYIELGDSKSAYINNTKAHKLAEELIKKDPDSALFLQDLARSYDRMGDLDNAIGDSLSARTNYESSLKIRKELLSRNSNSAVYARGVVVSYNKLNKSLELIEALKYMKRKNMHMDPPLVELCNQLGIPILMAANNLIEKSEKETTSNNALDAAENCFQDQKWKEAEQLFLNLLMQNIVAENLQYKIAVCILNGNDELSNNERNRVVNLIKQMKGLGKIIEADEIEQLLSKKNLD